MAPDGGLQLQAYFSFLCACVVRIARHETATSAAKAFTVVGIHRLQRERARDTCVSRSHTLRPVKKCRPFFAVTVDALRREHKGMRTFGQRCPALLEAASFNFFCRGYYIACKRGSNTYSVD